MEPKFEHSALEKDIQRLTIEVKEHKIAKPELSEKEAVRSVLGERIQAQPAPQSGAAAAQPSPVLPEYLRQESAEIKLKVEELVDLALHKGVDASISEAKKYGPFILDALHDSLTAKIYGELKSRKLL